MVTKHLLYQLIPVLVITTIFLQACSSSTSVSDEELNINLSSDTTGTDHEGNVYVIANEEGQDVNSPIPTISRYGADGDLQWKTEYDNSPVKVTGVVITLDELNRPWAVFHVDGDSGSSSYIRIKHVSENAFSNVYQPSYGMGGDVGITLIARINGTNGVIEKATFLSAQLSNGNSNTLKALAIGVNHRFVRVQAESLYTPPFIGSGYRPNPNATQFVDCNFFPTQIDLDINLKNIEASRIFTMQQLLHEPYSAWHSNCERK